VKSFRHPAEEGKSQECSREIALGSAGTSLRIFLRFSGRGSKTSVGLPRSKRGYMSAEEHSDDVESPARVPTSDLPRTLTSSGNIAFASQRIR